MKAQIESIINDLIEDTALLIAQRTDKETELECLEIGKASYEKKKDWVKVASYQGAMVRVQRDIDTLNELITPRLAEIRRAKEQETKNYFDNLLTNVA
jgi:hypothetical protein